VRAMRAIQVVETTGPEHVELREVPEPVPGTGEVLVEVHAVGVAFPDLLLSRGQYQMKPEPPFTLGADFAGVVVSGEGFEPGDRVVGALPHGGAADLVAVPREFVFPLPDRLSFEKGAALPMNYLTALFTLDDRAQLRSGEWVLVHGAAGGVGTASIQVAKAHGAQVIGVVSTPEKGEVAVGAGADHAILIENFRAAVGTLTDGEGVDVVVDPVGGDVFLDSLRCLAPGGRHMVVGFAAGQGIPEVKVNRLLLNNIDVRGVGWGAYALGRSGFMQSQWAKLVPMIESGVVDPPVAPTYELRDFAQALLDLDGRKALGKLVVTLR
jgi:NADPH:quinone reductase